MHGHGTPSVPRIVAGVARTMAECLFRLWPGKHVLPLSWPVILSYVDSHVPRRVVWHVWWSSPPVGSLKVNLSISASLGGTAALVRNLVAVSPLGLPARGLVDGARGLFQVLFLYLEWCIVGGEQSILVETSYMEFRYFFYVSVRSLWYFDAEIS